MTRRYTDTLRGLLALSPMMVFLASYVIASIIAGDFYKIPISLALVMAGVWGIVIMRPGALSERIDIFSRSAANSHVIYMIWIFILAGIFAALAKSTGAVEATVQTILCIFPSQLVIPSLFMTACLVSFAIGTSVGTVVALTPLAVEIAHTCGGDVAFFVAVILGGSFFGDNLSFISDTTIAATRTQGCQLNEKFKANIWIVVPAAIVTLLLYMLVDYGIQPTQFDFPSDWWLIVPYILVIILAIAGLNVTVVLILGITASVITGLFTGLSVIDLSTCAGSGIDSMGSLIVITLLASGMMGLMKEMGGIDWLLNTLSGKVNGIRGAQALICFLVAFVNLCTANNTVAIVTVGNITQDIASRHNVTPRKAASLLDTASCVVQCLIPYGAQTLFATALAGISPLAPFPYMYYPWVLAAITVLSIIFLFPRPKRIN